VNFVQDKKKKSTFQKVTMIVILFMLFATIAGVLLTALPAFFS
jgi:amino acid transporter